MYIYVGTPIFNDPVKMVSNYVHEKVAKIVKFLSSLWVIPFTTLIGCIVCSPALYDCLINRVFGEDNAFYEQHGSAICPVN